MLPISKLCVRIEKLIIKKECQNYEHHCSYSQCNMNEALVSAINARFQTYVILSLAFPLKSSHFRLYHNVETCLHLKKLSFLLNAH
jgi:hypothetical protein